MVQKRSSNPPTGASFMWGVLIGTRDSCDVGACQLEAASMIASWVLIPDDQTGIDPIVVSSPLQYSRVACLALTL